MARDAQAMTIQGPDNASGNAVPISGSITPLVVVSSFVNFSITVGAAAAQLSATSKVATRGVILRADPANSGTVYIGSANTVTPGTVAATDGLPLTAGDSMTLPVSNANLVWLIGSASGQKIFAIVA